MTATNHAVRRSHDRGEGTVFGTIVWIGTALVIVTLIVGAAIYVGRQFRHLTVDWGVPTLITQVRTSIGAATGSYGTGSLYTVVKLKELHPWVYTPDDAASNFTVFFGGRMAVAGAGNTFTVSLTELPQYLCMGAATRNYGQITTRINGTDYTPIASNTQAASACAAGNANTVDYVAQ